MRIIRWLMFLFALIINSGNAQDCGPFFPDADTTVGNVVIQQVDNVPENTEEGETIMTSSYNSSVLNEPTLDSSSVTTIGEEHLKGTVANDMVTVIVNNSMVGLPDYPDSVTEIQINYVFTFNTNSSQCVLQLIVGLKDENTQPPVTDGDNYPAEIREDFPALLQIPYLEIIAHDFDFSPPNNVIRIVFDDECPLESEEATYQPSSGSNVTITFILLEQLDYDTMADPYIECIGIVSDNGVPSVSTTVTIAITVTPFSDEPPKFEYPLYSSSLTQLEVTNTPLTIQPSSIHAEDGDNEAVTYSMMADSDTGSGPYNDYFLIDPDTADVTQVRDLPQDVLDLSSLFFIVTADDGSTASITTDTTVLQISLTEIIQSTTSTSLSDADK